MLSILWNLAAFIVALGVLITVHEFGHFWVARRCGVRVERFSIGFGKVLWRRTDKLGTEYVIALIPSAVTSKCWMSALNRWYRSCAITLSTIKRLAARGYYRRRSDRKLPFAIFAYWLVFIIGVHGVRPVVGEITPNSIAAQAQIQPGTELKAVDGIETLIGMPWTAVGFQNWR